MDGEFEAGCVTWQQPIQEYLEVLVSYIGTKETTSVCYVNRSPLTGFDSEASFLYNKKTR